MPSDNNGFDDLLPTDLDDPALYRRLLIERSPEAVIGYRRSPIYCPLARYLFVRRRTREPVLVFPQSFGYGNDLYGEIYSTHFPTPAWARCFIDETDNRLGVDTAEVTAAEALETLDAVLGAVLGAVPKGV